jgi:hypothetical protein
MKRAVLVGIVVVGMTRLMQAASYYVSPSGRDDKSCGSQQSPCKTINHAASKTAPGDTVYIQGGQVFHEQVNIPYSGSSGLPITFTSYGTGQAILDGNNGTLIYGYGIFCSSASNLSYIVIDNLTIQNYRDNGIDIEGPCDHVTIHNNHVTGNGLKDRSAGVS